MRVRHCSVKVVVQQPWLFPDSERLSGALTLLVSEVLAVRLSARLDRVGEPARLGTVAMRVALPVPVVLGLADGAPSGPEGRRLPSFGAEVAVHDAVSDALRAAFERAAFEAPAWPRDPGALAGAWPDGWARAAGPGGGPSGAAAWWPVPGAGAAASAEAAARSGGRLAAAVGDLLLAAVRHGRLRQLLRRSDPALVAEWVRLLASTAGWPVAPAAGSAGGASAPHGGGDRQAVRADGPGPGVAGTPARHAQVPGGAGGAPPPPHGRAGPATTAGWTLAGDGEGIASTSAAREGPPTTAEVEATVQAVLAALESIADGASIRLAAAVSAAARLRLLPSDPRLWRALERRLGPPTAEPSATPNGSVVPRTTDAHDAADGPDGAHAAGAGAAADAPDGPDASQADDATDAAPAGARDVADGPDGPDGPPAAGAADAKYAAGAPDAAPAGEAAGGPGAPGALGAGSTVAGAKLASPRPGRRQPAGRRELEVASVLPFLLVGPLDNLGVLDAVAAALAGPGWPDLLAAFAAGLARKALPPPADGWWQPDEVTATVAAFTGQDHSPDGTASERLGRATDRWWPVVEEALTATLVDLRMPGAPLVVTSSPGGLVAAGADGLAPLLWDGEGAAVRRLWERCGRPPVLADPSLAAPLAGLDPVHDPAPAEPLGELVALAGDRPAAGRPDLAPELDAPASLVAGVALAALAWQLWQRHGESTHPAMAARRLADLDGRVTLEPDRVSVRMPVGRRHADLRDSGLLRTVTDVPWLDGRVLELQGG